MRSVFVACLALCLSACAFSGGDAIRFKFQTSGQQLENVPIVERIIDGLTLKPASPSDAHIFRDAQNNALIQWRRRGRINYHWKDRAGVPVSEESEYYEIEVLSGSTVVRTTRVRVLESQPVQWDVLNRADLLTIATDGSGTISSIGGGSTSADFANVASKQRILGDFVFEFEIYNDGTTLFDTPSTLFIITVGNGGNTLGFIGHDPASRFFLSTSAGLLYVNTAPGDRIAIEYKQGVTTYYKNPTSDRSPAIYREATPADYAPYWVYASFGFLDVGGMRNPQLLRFDTPDWTYSADMQTADGLTPGSPIHLRIYQTSAAVGRGQPLDITL